MLRNLKTAGLFETTIFEVEIDPMNEDKNSREGKTVSVWDPTLPATTKQVDDLFDKRIRILFLGAIITIGINFCTAIAIFISLHHVRTEFIDGHVKKLFLLKDLEVSIESGVAANRAFILTGDLRFEENERIRQADTIGILQRLQTIMDTPREKELFAKLQESLSESAAFTKRTRSLQFQKISKTEVIDFFETSLIPSRDAVAKALADIANDQNVEFQTAEMQSKNIWNLSFVLFSAVAFLSLLFFATLKRVLGNAIKEKQKAEAALRISEMISQQAVELTEIGIFNHDHLSNQIYLSPELQRISGRGPHELSSIEMIMDSVHPADRDRVAEGIAASHDPAGTGHYEIEHRVIHQNGSVRWVAARGQTFFDRSTHPPIPTKSIGVILDITNQKEVEISLRHALKDLAWEKLKLERSNAELEQFASIAAHDLRAPLSSMLGWVGILDRLIPKPREETIDKAINFITGNTKKADALIADLLQIARLKESNIKAELIDLNRLSKDVVEMFNNQIKATNAKIHINPLPTIRGCPSHLTSVLSNLLRNALTYRDKSRPLEVYISCNEMDNGYKFSVKDNGIGIDPKYTTRIFEMFKRLHPENDQRGTGIGLAYCKKVIELNGGRIWVESEPNIGSTFHFTCPTI